ncbi:MAG: cysteine--tRNA ligase [Dehalococcoidales bacterium]|nr:cysteine--tRNA ligase [Dehalococcoidales bacterium]
MKIFNTLSGQKEEFVPLSGAKSRDILMYVCGVTPYSDSHVGHAMSYIYFDVIRRYLKFRGYTVKYVQNLTDIDDKIIDRANRLGVSVNELSGKYIQGFFDDMTALNILPADLYPRATQEIPKMLEIVKSLVDKGFAYPAKGSVYFRVRSVADYGKLSHRTLDSMEAGIRVEPGEEKEHPMDFVLWKASKPGEPSWPSSWGPGRPGWHIECSAMSVKYLGEQIDIHGGGQDLIFPHHENELVQSESFTGKKPFVKYWMHNGLLRLGEEKMSKSLGNLVTIKEALSKYSADAIRLFVLGSYYRSPLTYSTDALEAAERGAGRLRQVMELKDNSTREDAGRIDVSPYQQRFAEVMDDDFGTAQAIAVLFDMARDINRAKNAGQPIENARKALLSLANVLGLTLNEALKTGFEAGPFFELLKEMSNKIRQAKLEQVLTQAGLSKDGGETEAEAQENIGKLLRIRNVLREQKQFQLADEIRGRLKELGVVFEDAAGQTIWKRKI